ncbi:MAG: alpha/beta hydrolase [Patescibacteria group bacterium]
MERHILHNRKKQTIVGILYTPQYHPRGTAIISPGWRSNKDEAVVIAIKEAFIRARFQVFVYDATNSQGESDGDPALSTHGLHYEDLEDVVMWAREQKWFISPLVVSGHSRGAYAAVRFVQSHPTRVRYLVAVAPVVSGQLSDKTFKQNDPLGYARWSERKPEMPNTDYSGVRRLWSKIRRRVNYDLRPQAHLILIPTLLVGGNRDVRCPPRHLRKLHRAIGSRDKTLEIIEKAVHRFSTPESQSALSDTIYRWLSQRLDARDTKH